MSEKIIKFPESCSTAPLFYSGTDTPITQILIDDTGKVKVFKSKEELIKRSSKYLALLEFESQRLSNLSLNKLSFYDKKTNRLIYYPIIQLNSNFIINFCYLNVIEKPKKISTKDWEAVIGALSFYMNNCYESGKLVQV